MDYKGLFGFLMKKIVISLLFLFSIIPINAKDLSLQEIISSSGAKFSWHSLRELGMLSKDNKQIYFLVNGKALMLGSTVSRGRVYYNNNELFFDSSASEAIINYFDGIYIVPKPKSNSKHQVSIILIDAGHGGKDPGTIGKHVNFEIMEKDVCLTIAKELEVILKQAYPHKKIMMTRSKDEFISLEERVKIANNLPLKNGESAVYVSIHVNSSFNKDAKGFEIWHLPSNINRAIVDKNEVKGKSATQKIVNSLLNEEFFTEGKKFASVLLDEFVKDFGKITDNRGLKEESWFVIKNSYMAAVLIEVGFLSNYEEARRLKDKTYLKKMSKTIYNGIDSFIKYFEKV